MTNIFLVLLAVIAVLMVILIVLVVRLGSGKLSRTDLDNAIKNSNDALNDRIDLIDDNIKEKIDIMKESVSDRQNDMKKSIDEALSHQSQQLSHFTVENDNRLDGIRKTVQERLDRIQEDNNKKLDDMRNVVDEKLQVTLEKKMTESFGAVSKRLEEVHKGLGDMQNLAKDVGGLKNVLSNVKTRGILGEIQLGTILKESLAPEQYEENVAVVPGSSKRVEFAIKLPGSGDGHIYLPIDSKFPGDTYQNLLNAYDTGDKDLVETGFKELRTRIISEAKDINEKYISPPHTTNFAIMFLPFEGLYAEVVQRGLVEELQNNYKVNIAGPSTMAALLNSLQMGFRTLQIQEKSTEVWKLLEEVKEEFKTFSEALDKAHKSIVTAETNINNLRETRTRQMQRKLEKIETRSE